MSTIDDAIAALRQAALSSIALLDKAVEDYDAALIASPNPPPTPTTRDARYWPFSQNSPWNTPIGSNAVYGNITWGSIAGYEITRDYTVQVIVASASNPLRNVYTNTAYPATNWNHIYNGNSGCNVASFVGTPVANSGAAKNGWSTTPSLTYRASSLNWRSQVRAPAWCPEAGNTDAFTTIIQTDGWTLDLYCPLVRGSDGAISGDGCTSMIDLRGDGTAYWNGRRASMLPTLAGLIRSGELAAGVIPHALTCCIPATCLVAQAVWPAWAYDTNNNYSGTIPMGSLLAIPPTVNLSTLGLSTKGLIAAKAAQDYGIYVVDRGGSGISIYSELNNPDATTTAWSTASSDAQKIIQNCKRVTNNSSSNVGGGGTRRAPLAPAIA